MGKWIMSEGSYNGSVISDISGYFEFLGEDKYYAKIDKGTSYARASSYYSIDNAKLKCTMPSTIILNGMSMGMSGDKSYYTSISMSNTDFSQIGGTAIGYDNSHIIFTISDNILTLESSNGNTKIKYTKE